MKTVEALNFLNRGYGSWTVVTGENVRTPASRKEYTTARKMYRKSLKLGCTEKWLITRQKEMNNRLMSNKKRVFVGSWMTLIFALILVFFFTGGIKGCSAQRHLSILKSETAISASVVANGAKDVFKNGNLDETREMLQGEQYRARRAESASLWYRLGILWVIAFILYLLAARAPLYLVQTRLYRLVKPSKSASPADYLRPDMAAAPGAPSAESTEPSYEKRNKKLLIAAGWALLFALLLPLMVVVEFFRNFILFI
jgi:predicted nucleic acid-binding Zn ribbon protein